MFMKTVNDRLDPKAGQAMAELIIALVVVMVLAAGIIQLGTLGIRHTQVMGEARRIAAVQAMSDLSPFAGPNYIADRTPGADVTRYSRDDGYTAGDINAFQSKILAYAHPADLNGRVGNNVVSVTANSPFPHFMFGMAEGQATETVPLWPVVRRLLYNAASVDVAGDAWLIWTKGIY